jgi:hypothetical protein
MLFSNRHTLYDSHVMDPSLHNGFNGSRTSGLRIISQDRSQAV